MACTAVGVGVFSVFSFDPPPSFVSVVGAGVSGASVLGPPGAGVGTGVGGKSQSISPPSPYSSGTQQGQSTKGTCNITVMMVAVSTCKGKKYNCR